MTQASLRERVLLMLHLADPVTGVTATALCKFLNDASQQSDHVKLSTLSSLLTKMYDVGDLNRIKGVGPRGGFGYTLAQTEKKDHR